MLVLLLLLLTAVLGTETGPWLAGPSPMSFPLSLAVSAFDLFLSVVCDGSFLTNGAVVTMVVRRLSLVAIRDVVESEERLLVQAKRVALTLRV